MPQSRNARPLAILLGIGLFVLFIDLIEILPHAHRVMRGYIFIVSTVIALLALDKKDYYFGISYITIAFIYNPFIPLLLLPENWRYIHVPVMGFLSIEIYRLMINQETDRIEHIAQMLDQYFRELETIVANQPYTKTILYFKRRYPATFQLTDIGYTWQDPRLPHFNFFILSDFFTPHHQKGGISAIGHDEFASIEMHQNFSLTERVKFTVKLSQRPKHPLTPGATRLVRHLIQKYHYIDFIRR